MELDEHIYATPLAEVVPPARAFPGISGPFVLAEAPTQSFGSVLVGHSRFQGVANRPALPC